MSLTDKEITDSYMKSSKFLTAPETRLEVFAKHWQYALKTMSKEYPTLDESEPVIYYMEEMVSLLIEEKSSDSLQVIGPIFQFSLNEDIFNKIYNWCSKCSGDILEKVKHQQLRLFAAVVSQGHPSVLLQREGLLQPLLRLLNEYSIRSSHKLEKNLVNLLKLISVRASNEPTLQSLCTDIGINLLNDPLPLLNPLVPFLHRDGILGQDAKDAVLLLLTLSTTNEDVACSVALQSDFCPVLATGLSALYSALPRKLPAFCHSVLLGQLSDPIISKIPELQHFLNYLSFCCQVNEVTHPLIREAVLHYIYNGFLLPVIGSSLNQSSLDEVTAATIYFDLFLRTITDKAILKAFLCFTIAESHDGFRILDSLINRMSLNTGLGVSTLSLMHTLLSFNCEDIMFELIFRYLIPCHHLSIKRRDSICDKEILLRTCESVHDLHFDFLGCFWQLDQDLLEITRNLIEMRGRACEQSWHFDYNGINPSFDYLEKVMDPNYFQNHKPFHGFLDHYTQLLEMRDICKRNSIQMRNSVGSQSPSSTATFDISGSCHFTPRSQLSRSNSAETVTSIKFEIDSQLDKCLHRLRFPSEEDLLEQKSRYMITYNMLGDFGNDSIDSTSITSPPSQKSAKENINMEKFSKGFDMQRSITPESQESISNEFIFNFEDIESLVNCKDIEEFIALLDKMKINAELIQSCELSLEEVFNLITTQLNSKEDEPEHIRHPSPIGSIMSLQSGITIDDNILRDNTLLNRHIKSRSNHVSDKRFTTVGQFLYTLLDRLENFHTNPFQINLQITSILISLLSFPQPLLRNYLLDPSETFTDGLKSLYGVLKSVRDKIIEMKIKINICKGNDSFFQSLCFEAKSHLERRSVLLEEGDFESEEIYSICGCPPNSESDVFSKNVKSPKKNFGLMQFLSRKSARKSNQENEISKQLNIAYSTIILDNFFEEVVAFSKEHSVYM